MRVPTVVETSRKEGEYANPLFGRSRVGAAALYRGACSGDGGRGGRRLRRTERTGAQHSGDRDRTSAQERVSDTKPAEGGLSLYGDRRASGVDDRAGATV